MPSIDFVVGVPIQQTTRVQQLSALFDVPPIQQEVKRWSGEVPIEGFDWHVGLIVGPSGCGKTSILRNVWGKSRTLTWANQPVIDDFDRALSMQDISAVCQAVGFNTIPAWMRPYHVLSNGEKFRVELARRLIEDASPIILDEFTSVVDRQIAKIGSHAVQKYARAKQRQVIAASCHYDILDWLQPDWVLEPATMSFTRRSLQRRPALDATVSRVPYAAWHVFAPFHYLTATLHRAAACFAIFVEGRIASFGGMLHRPHPKADDIMGLSRLVTLPDWQGLGLAMILADALGAGYKALGKRMHTYPAHPTLVRSFDKSPNWRLIKKPGTFSAAITGPRGFNPTGGATGQGGRPNATFEYVGIAMAKAEAERLIEGRA